MNILTRCFLAAFLLLALNGCVLPYSTHEIMGSMEDQDFHGVSIGIFLPDKYRSLLGPTEPFLLHVIADAGEEHEYMSIRSARVETSDGALVWEYRHDPGIYIVFDESLTPYKYRKHPPRDYLVEFPDSLNISYKAGRTVKVTLDVTVKMKDGKSYSGTVEKEFQPKFERHIAVGFGV